MVAYLSLSFLYKLLLVSKIELIQYILTPTLSLEILYRKLYIHNRTAAARSWYTNKKENKIFLIYK
jgi:hypothetical protein